MGKIGVGVGVQNCVKIHYECFLSMLFLEDFELTIPIYLRLNRLYKEPAAVTLSSFVLTPQFSYHVYVFARCTNLSFV